MYVSPVLPLTLARVRTAPIPALQAAVKTWLERENPLCLMHPHGFHVVLLGRTETEEWRLHFWLQGPRTITGMPAFIHTHDGHLESRILQGQVTNILYDVVEVPTGGYPLYEVAYNGDRYTSATLNFLRRTTTRVRHIVRCRRTLESGNMYHVEPYTYHESVVSARVTTSTLVCIHGRSLGAAMVIGLDGHPETVGFRRTENHAIAFTDQLFT